MYPRSTHRSLDIIIDRKGTIQRQWIGTNEPATPPEVQRNIRTTERTRYLMMSLTIEWTHWMIPILPSLKIVKEN